VSAYLSPDANAVIEGRHSDLFRHLGMHTEGGVSGRTRTRSKGTRKRIGWLAAMSGPSTAMASSCNCM
jgi:hypothetical protein